ncbi:hypothetical protein EV356DRAFT_574147 [Viridothelium virens]|uniref:Adenylyltransferase and sulfurtransferase uba4 n=1 Tax=Viridothelium virens TaxID=1048519 RepID=A0A6A6HHI4_VIRVR|nr:hypothetical protein EV356DRAFT_574147 [Viridothelium virens]
MFSTSDLDRTITTLRNQIVAHESQLRKLKEQLVQAELRASNIDEAKQAHDLQQAYRGGLMPEWQQETWDALCNTSLEANENHLLSKKPEAGAEQPGRWELELEEYRRYGRQLILPEMGLQGQLRLKDAKICIVGAGGLGCPAAAYLAGAGVGTIGLVDGDTVEISNLHRQVLHSTAKVGMPKVDSVSEYITALNPNVKVITHLSHLSPTTALDTLHPYTLILDCTDSPQSRYLISDACVLLHKPLVSASALRTDGQLMILNHPALPAGNPLGGPCYRCIFPKPPPPTSVVSCGEGGVLGSVVGVMGVLQALEAIKLVVAGLQADGSSGRETRQPEASGAGVQTKAREGEGEGGPGVETPQPDAQTQCPPQPELLIFSAMASPPFRSIRLRSRRAACAACSAVASVTPESLKSGSLDYAQFCGVLDPVNLLPPEDRISAAEYARLVQRGRQRDGDAEVRPGHVLVDVRERTQFELCRLPGSINWPMSELALPLGRPLNGTATNANGCRELKSLEEEGGVVVVVCRLGNDSQLAVKRLREMRLGEGKRVVDIKGGLKAWREEVDDGFPEY